MSAPPPFKVDPLTAKNQCRAADPLLSVWVSANAGAGKTKVLTDRVIRLLLAGTPPSRILCLTFTKAAAAEMTIRVFKTLGSWVTMEDGTLAKALQDLTGSASTPALRARARRLFARAVETPGGLKIETIHAFCERVLHLVPFEAQVPARFAVLDDAEAARLTEEARDGILIEAASGRPDLAGALDIVTADASGDGLTQLLDRAVADPGLPQDRDTADVQIGHLTTQFGLRAGETPDAIRRQMVEDGIPLADWPAIAGELALSSKKTDLERGDALMRASGTDRIADRLACYREMFFTEKGKGSPRVDVVTKGIAADIKSRLTDERDRLVALDARLLAAEAVERTAALFTLAGAIRTRMEALKRRRGALDFGDLIAKTLRLLEDGAAAWVLYRLDRGIDHVLVDEAQDTNADQWRILRRLTEEFTSGAGLPGPEPRTMFAVGDPKQSIYSFQGADPRLFEESRRHWTTRSRAAGLDFAHVTLDLSFRSAPAILDIVDQTFRVPAHFQGLSFDDAVTGTAHSSARPTALGEVEIWPTEMPQDVEPDPEAWSRPVDEPGRDAPAMKVASRIARAVKGWTDAPDPATGRRWRAGDILILARKRGPAFFACIRALKMAGIPVAGADRIEIGQDIAVMDLVAAGQAALLPENDLVLAAALKSPLVGLDDDDLIRIAADRPEGESLAAALARLAPRDDAARAGLTALSSWRDLARRHGPFGFYATLLGPGGGRRRLVERLGGEAADAIDTFLCRAVLEEAGPTTPSLTTFLHRFETDRHVIKRDPEAAGDEVRVMTVHGAKGLEAPLVILLDGCEVQGPDPKLIPLLVPGQETPIPVWSPRMAADPTPLAESRLALKHRGQEEHHRLLYVALTRARDRLVVVPFKNSRGPEPEAAWSRMVRRGFEVSGRQLARIDTHHGPVDLWREGTSARIAVVEMPGAGPPIGLPDWLERAVPPEPEAPPPLRPSGVLGAADREPPDRYARAGMRNRARLRGTLVHAVIERLASAAPEARPDLAAHYLAIRAAALGGKEREAIVTDALGVLDHPDLAPLFAPGSRGEVAIAGRVGPAGLERAVSGQIDRLAVTPEAILLADFKTGPIPPNQEVPDGILAQLALYRALLREIHPARPVRAFIVWTQGPDVVEPAPALLDAALERALSALPRRDLPLP